MPAQLVAQSEGPNIILDKGVLLIGRHPECDIQIESRKISRQHCCVAYVSDYLVVRDLGSTNGIRINGVRVQEGRLRAGDELTIGNARYKVSWSESGKPDSDLLEKELAPASDPNNVDDVSLESCDEPVALPEPENLPPDRSSPQVGRPMKPPQKRDEGFTDKPSLPPSNMGPDDISLAPSSSDA